MFRVKCSKGTYVRTLVEDIAAAAGTVAYTSKLHRETVGGFSAEDMLDLTDAETAAEEGPEPLREHERVIIDPLTLDGLRPGEARTARFM